MPAARNRVSLIGTVVGQSQTWQTNGAIYLRALIALGSACQIKIVAKDAVAAGCGALQPGDRVDVEGRLDGRVVDGPGGKPLAVARVIAQRLDNLGPAGPDPVTQ